MLTSNEFLGGIDKDTDVLKIENTKLRDARNIRILNKDGQGLVVTNIGGNELSFNLSPGFIPLGHDEYNGVAYILSYNPTTGEGEYGTFPSPFPGYVGGFQTVYSPLYNYTGAVDPATPGAVKVPFRTELFNVDCEHQARVKVRVDYDNSVNIYWTDYKNPMRSINCGFNQEGIFNGRLYWDGSFPNAVDLISETCAQPISNLGIFNPLTGKYENGIVPGGCLNSGTYFFFFRYNTLNFNPTSYVAETSAIQISPNLDSDSIQIQGAPGYPVASVTKSGKQIYLSLSNLDVNYPYLEIAFINYYDNTSSAGIIDILFPLTIGSTTAEINITGCEPIRDATVADILQKKIDYDVVKDIAQLENRLWGANCKKRVLFDPSMIEFAKNVIATPDDSLELEDVTYEGNSSADMSKLQYKSYNNRFNSVGYFRGETYAFAIRYVFKNGRLSEPIPVAGYDALLDPGAIVKNDQGILRFPSATSGAGQSPYEKIVAGTRYVMIMGVRFNITAIAQGIFNSSQFLTDNVCGFYFCRGERNPNLIYQGVSISCVGITNDPYNGIDELGPLCTPWISSPSSPNVNANGFVVPNFTSPYSPFKFRQHCINWYGGGDDGVYNQSIGIYQTDSRYGFLSSDHFFKKTFPNRKHVIQKLANVSWASFGFLPFFFDTYNYSWLSGNQIYASHCYNVQEWNPAPVGPGTEPFTSYFDDGSETGASSWYYSYWSDLLGIGYATWINSRMAYTRYIGIDGSDSIPAIPSKSLDNSLVNIYTEDPALVDILNYYDVKAVKYQKISDFVDASNLSTISAIVFYRGDCFIQRTYHKLLYNPYLYHPPSGPDQGQGGILYGLLTENVINTAMRNDTNSLTYYPQTGLNDLIWNDGNFEADNFNFGYIAQLSGEGAFGYDVTIPFRQDVYPTRVIYSSLHIANAFLDGYRQFDLASYQDFDYRMGPINAMLNLASRMVIIQQTGISFLYINDRQALTQNATTAQLLIGDGNTLSKKQNTITDIMGTQHQWSVVSTEKALYGVDATKRKIWQLLPDGQLEAISDTKSYRKQLYEIVEQGLNGDRSDITRNIPDNPVCTGGIVGSYERKYNDVIFTFLFDKKSKKNNYSIRFNEWGQHFTDKYDNITAYYIAINEDFFSFNPNIFPSITATPSGSGAAYLEGVRVTSLGAANNCRFYGVQYQMSLSWITNNASDQEKAFDFIALNASPNEPFSIKYRTINQLATQAPFVNPLEKWNQPSYRENEWRFPIRRADIPQGTVNNIFGVNSYMRGTWMQSELVYYTNESIFVKSAITNIRASKQ